VPFAPYRRWRTASGPIVGEWERIGNFKRAKRDRVAMGEQRMYARASIETNLDFHGKDLRLEHELQTVSAERQRTRRYRGFS